MKQVIRVFTLLCFAITLGYSPANATGGGGGGELTYEKTFRQLCWCGGYNYICWNGTGDCIIANQASCDWICNPE